MTTAALIADDPSCLVEDEPRLAVDAPTASHPAAGIERNPAAIETALHQLARAVAQTGVLFTARQEDIWPRGMPDTDIGRMIAHPISQACMNAEFRLIQHLIALVGREAANVVWQRVQLRAFEEFEQPLIRAFHAVH